jgi:hypothetical protein
VHAPWEDVNLVMGEPAFSFIPLQRTIAKLIPTGYVQCLHPFLLSLAHMMSHAGYRPICPRVFSPNVHFTPRYIPIDAYRTPLPSFPLLITSIPNQLHQQNFIAGTLPPNRASSTRPLLPYPHCHVYSPARSMPKTTPILPSLT